ncbi:MAG: NfeD family protein [Bacilli bacterium]|nr:NfeD family protein [Bacilli bacterium]
MEAYMWAIWLGVFILALVIEGITTELAGVWFAFGALVAMIISFISGVPWWVQLIVFIVVSGATLACLRPVVNKFLKRDKVETNVDEMIGKVGVMVKECDELNSGEVRINGVLWTAINTDEKKPLSKGDKVEVLAIKGNKLIVKSKEKGGN